MLRLVLLSILIASSSYGNDAPVRSVGKNIEPLKDSPVRMVSEEVRIRLNAERAYVDCMFNLVNEGKPDTIEVGFPRGWESDLIDFFARTNKEILPVQTLSERASYNEMNGENLPWWKVFKVPFPEQNYEVRVYNQYTTYLNPGMSSGYPNPYNDRSFTYILKTGAPWKGTIGEATITIYHTDIPFEQITKISPQGYTREDRKIVWNFKDFEPVENIEIEIMNDLLFERMTIAKNILERDPDNALGHYFLGTFYFEHPLQNKNNAEKEFNAAIALDPGLLDAKWFLAALYATKYPRTTEQIDKAIDILEKINNVNAKYFCNDKVFKIVPEFPEWQVVKMISILEDTKEWILNCKR